MGSLVGTVMFFFVFLAWQAQASAVKQPYIVYLGEHSHAKEEGQDLLAQDEQVRGSHHKFLGSFIGSVEKAKDVIFYSYTRHINGFAAYLEAEEAQRLSNHPDVISVFLSKKRKLHTTHTWEFLGLEKDGQIPEESIWNKSKLGEDVIIGNLDTGVWPDSESFNDKGMGPIPSRWKGECQRGKDGEVVIKCNRKLIGAKYFNRGYMTTAGSLNAKDYSAIDYDGHGTHTLSTAGGGFVGNASMFGHGKGTAKGGAPNARVAAYKVCYDAGCYDADILAGFDAAIHDGVDIISVSLGGSLPLHYSVDSIAIGSFHAVKSGIIVVCAASNSGPTPGTVDNMAPWIVTVAASTIDRQFTSVATLGNHKRLKGQSLSSTFLENDKSYPLISGADAAASKAPNLIKLFAIYCHNSTLDPEKVKGKIVACAGNNMANGEAIRLNGGVGVIFFNMYEPKNWTNAAAHIIPATHITYAEGVEVLSYSNSSKAPMASISKPITKIGTKPAPFMAYFSSKGPNSINPEILKPDITAPGVSIIAAFTQARGPAYFSDPRRVLFSAMSGTSVSTPMVAGVAGLLKALHPDWSPAAIKSAIMTTASVIDNRKESILDASFVTATPFDYGSGHIDPNLAMDPGLVYDTTVEDYMIFLCSIGYNSWHRYLFTNATYTCPTSELPKIVDLNYPSITIPRLNSKTTVRRRVKNVGPSKSAKYTVRVTRPPGVLVSVYPTVLAFSKIGEEKSFKVTFRPYKDEAHHYGQYVYGRMTWSDGNHKVTSPLVVGFT